ncbi:tRNA lysidine(34) synthetase TilS [Thalassotalea mangrovi]|uniref:tRNA(Ile)-lysidine synthase n=1 Tax=Thalassotalea mangrovi TaxID=2572245 RepID=A0A4U1B3B9_9GAMM|nr:tRNA lysidine(34) synthetase TilS [Thalassotalea mangrovi]TKB44144.1 tRNA lysidine(34) synthetase TilS [Thalassotalea mangrovi]
MDKTVNNPVYAALLKFFAEPQLVQKNLLVAYSGGLDSQVLLHALASLKQQGHIATDICAVHINHGLSRNADHWQSFTRQQCEMLDVDYRAIRVDVNNVSGGGIEEKARNARYQALAEIRTAQDIILTAHHQDDQAETFLLALKRGAGVLGLAAMQPLRQNSAVGLLGRPLLDVSRAQLQHYAEQRQLTWVEDESNQDTRFDRNFLRQQVLPLIQSRWPDFSASVVKSAAVQRQTQSLLEELAQIDLGENLANQPIALDTFNRLSQSRQINALRFRFKQLGLRMPEHKPLLQAINQIATAAIDKNPEVKCGDAVLRRYQQKLFITRDFQDIQSWTMQLDTSLTSPYRVSLPDSSVILCLHEVSDAQSGQSSDDNHDSNSPQFLCVADEAEIRLSCHHDNPVCKPQGRDKSRPLKKVLQERGIPPWLRRRLVFIYVDNIFAGVVGHFICEDFTLAANMAHNKRIIKITTE